MGKTIAKGCKFLQAVVHLPVDADNLLVEAAATPMCMGGEPGGRAVHHAASLPLGVQCQLEHLAAAPRWSVTRAIARAVLITAMAHGLRLNDALNASVWLEGDVLVGCTTVRSKDGLPLGLFAPASGFLGLWPWVKSHLAEMDGRPHAIPDFNAAVPSAARRLLSGVLPQRKARALLQE